MTADVSMEAVREKKPERKCREALQGIFYQ